MREWYDETYRSFGNNTSSRVENELKTIVWLAKRLDRSSRSYDRDRFKISTGIQLRYVEYKRTGLIHRIEEASKFTNIMKTCLGNGRYWDNHVRYLSKITEIAIRVNRNEWDIMNAVLSQMEGKCHLASIELNAKNQCSRISISVRILFFERYARTPTYYILACVERYVNCTLVTVAF